MEGMMVRELTTEEKGCLLGCRSYKQYYEMRRKFEDGTCVFCNLDRDFNKVYWEDDFVFCWPIPDAYQRKELLHQFLIVPKRHVRFPWHLSEEEWLSLHFAGTVLAENYDFEGGMLFARFGDMGLNAGTMPHLHYNLWVPNQTGEVRIPIYKDLGDREANRERAAVFAEQYERGEVPQ